MQSCRKQIQLHHLYYNIFPIPVEPESAVDLPEAILYTIYILNQHYGSTQMEIVAEMNQLFPQYTNQQICDMFTSMLKDGILRTLQPVCINYCAPPVPVTFTINQNIDQKEANYNLVLFLVALSGGTRTKSATFNAFFKPYVNPNLYSNSLNACGSF